MFNIKSDKVSKNNKNIIINTPIKESTGNINNEYNRNLQNNLLKDKSLIIKDIEEEKFDIEIYEKFLMFLQFQERMKKRN